MRATTQSTHNPLSGLILLSCLTLLFGLVAACNQPHPAPAPPPAAPSVALPAPVSPTAPDPLAAAMAAENAAAQAAEQLPRDPKQRPAVGMLNGPCPLPGEDAATCPRKPADNDKGPWKAAHILIGWHGSLPGEGPDRDQEQARELAIALGHEARRKGADFIALVWQHGDDAGEALYDFDAASRRRFPPPFTDLVTAMAVGNVDVVRSRLGYHVVKRLGLEQRPRPRPIERIITETCPLAGEAPGACPKKPAQRPERVVVRHILVGYKGALARRATSRTEAAARELAVELAHSLRRQEATFEELAGRHSDDPGNGVYVVTPDARLVPPFKTLALGLSVGNVDVVRTRFGYHVIERIEPPAAGRGGEQP